MEQQDWYDQNLFEEAKLIQNQLFQKQWLDNDNFELIMEEELQNKWFSYRGIFTVRAIGLLKLTSFIPTVATLLGRDEDILLEETAKALIRFQTDDVVKSVKPYAMKDSTCIFALSVLGNTKTELAEITLADCYPVLDEEGKGMVIEELAHQLSEKAFPLIDDYLQHNYYYTMSDMEQILYSFHKIMGREHPDSNNWKAIYEERERRQKEASENLFNFSKNGKMKSEPVIVEKVGRNDPCSCGSGKKFKKCCGK